MAERKVRGVGRIGVPLVFCLGAILIATAAGAADMMADAPALATPASAVDGVNGKADAFGGSLAGHSFYGASGSLSVPAVQQFGLQFDGLAGSYQGDFLGGVGAHAFWRDPSRGLLGFYGSYAYLDRFGGSKIGHFGPEAAAYFGRVTIEGALGIESGNKVTGTVGGFTQTIDFKTQFFDRVDLAFYPIDDLRLSIGHRYTGGSNQLALGGEWAFGSYRNSKVAVFVEGRVGEHDTSSVWSGLRLYFGQREKSLIRRHREDDPVNGLTDDAGAYGGASSSTPIVTTGLVCTPPAVLNIFGQCVL